MNSDFTFIEIDIGEWILAIDGSIEAESELSHHNLTFRFHYEAIDLLKSGWKVGRGKYSSFLDSNQEWGIMNDFKSISWVRFDECLSRYALKIDRLSKYLPDWESSSLVFTVSIVSGISPCSLHFSERKYVSF